MHLYAETAQLRLRQQLSDSLALGWVWAWSFAGRGAYRTIEHLRLATASAEQAGAGFAGRLDDVARGVARLPIVGADLRRPFNGAAAAGRSLENAGASAGHTVHTIALSTGIALALIPVLWLAFSYGRSRFRWVRESTAARSIRSAGEGAMQLFALRAVTNAPLRALRRADPDPAGSLARGDYDRLAAIELTRLGLRPPAPT